jgi:AcrR family transcriptional regulator
MRSQATFDAVVEATARILSEDGPEHLKTNRIAERAGVSVGSLYQYFPHRQAIVRALVERELARAEALRPPLLDDPTRPPAERIRAAVDWHFDVHAARPALAKALRGLVLQVLPSDEARRLAQHRSDRIARMIASLGVDVDADAAAFIVDTCLDALSDAATARKPAWLRSDRFRAEVAALITGYLTRRS